MNDREFSFLVRLAKASPERRASIASKGDLNTQGALTSAIAIGVKLILLGKPSRSAAAHAWVRVVQREAKL